MALPVIRLKVYVNGSGEEPDEHEVTISHADRLAAEVQMAALGLDQEKLPQHLMTAWAWAALKRDGVYSGPFGRFMATDCEGFEDIADEDEEVPPTSEAEPTGELSSSPSATPEPLSATG